MTAEFGLLGPLSVRADDGARPVAAARLRTILGALLLNANAPVPVADLADIVWDENPPPQARTTLQSYVMRLRRALGESLGARLVTRPGGYQMVVGGGELDVRRFEDHFRAGAASAGSGQWERCGTDLRTALGLWRGAALADIPSEVLLRGEGVRLNEMRQQALELRIQADLRGGRHGEVVAELRALVTEFPLRERLWEGLMLSLYRSGQQAAALTAYQEVRQVLIDQLGVEPGNELRRLHQLILRADPDLLRPAAGQRPQVAHLAFRVPANTFAPCTLPPDIDDFTGRADQTEELEEHLRCRRETAVAVAVLTGPGGTGKTTLAVHAAHRLRKAFPDGQLYLNLGGSQPKPADPDGALAALLFELGQDPRLIPEGLQAQASTFRRLVADKRILVVLDDAVSHEQVAPLLPGRAGCGVIITSRDRLAGLPGTRIIDVTGFSEDEARDLLARVAGRERVTAGPAVAAEIIRLCGTLPLAVRIAAARLAARPHWSPAQLAARLSDDNRRLDELSFGAMDIRATLAASFLNLSPQAHQLLRQLSALDLPCFPGAIAASVLGVPGSQADDVIDELIVRRLLEPVTQSPPGLPLYRIPELVKVFAKELAHAEEPGTEEAIEPPEMYRNFTCLPHAR